jgi:hypothetical protein
MGCDKRAEESMSKETDQREVRESLSYIFILD